MLSIGWNLKKKKLILRKDDFSVLDVNILNYWYKVGS